MHEKNTDYSAAELQSNQLSKVQTLESELRSSTDDEIVLIAYNKH